MRWKERSGFYRLGWSMISTIAVMFAIPIYAVILRPAVIIESAESLKFSLLFLIGPIMLGVVFIVIGLRRDRNRTTYDHRPRWFRPTAAQTPATPPSNEDTSVDARSL